MTTLFWWNGDDDTRAMARATNTQVVEGWLAGRVLSCVALGGGGQFCLRLLYTRYPPVINDDAFLNIYQSLFVSTEAFHLNMFSQAYPYIVPVVVALTPVGPDSHPQEDLARLRSSLTSGFIIVQRFAITASPSPSPLHSHATPRNHHQTHPLDSLRGCLETEIDDTHAHE